MIKFSIKKELINYLIICSFTAALFYSIYEMFFGKIIPGIVSFIFICVSLGFYIYFKNYFGSIKNKLMQMELKYSKREKALQKLQSFYNGYNGKFSEKFSIYSKMIGSGVKLPVANSIINFAYEVTPKDTIFLVRLNHDENIFYMKMGGLPIYYQQAKDLFEEVKKQCDVIAADDFIVWKEKNIDN